VWLGGCFKGVFEISEPSRENSRLKANAYVINQSQDREMQSLSESAPS
jgi:hypothetical protein